MAGSASVHIPFTAADGISPKISKINKSMGVLTKNTRKSSIAIGSAIGTFVGGVALSAFRSLTTAIGSAVDDAVVFQKLGDQLAATIKTTGNAAQVSVKGIQDLASGLESMSGVDEKLIINGANVLASFKNIRNEGGKAGGMFDRTLESALNLSTTMGGDVVGATALLGKALVDPTKGLSKLTRAGVTFTDAETERIKSLQAAGKLTKAQGIILAKVEGRYNGAAEAAGKGFAGSVARAKDAVSDMLRDGITPLLDPLAKLADKVVTDVVPAIKGMADTFNRDIRPGLEQVIRQIASGLAPVLAIIGDILRNVVLPAIGSFFGFLKDNKEIVLAIVAGVIAMVGAFKTYQMVMTAVQAVMKAYAAVQAIVNIVMSANPVGIIVLAIIGLIAAFAALYASSEGFRDAVGGLFNALGTAFGFVIDMIRTIIGFFWNGPMGLIIKAIAGLAGIDLSGIDGFINGGAAPGGTTPSTVPRGSGYSGMPTTVNVKIGNEQLVPTVTRVMGSTANAGTGRRGY